MWTFRWQHLSVVDELGEGRELSPSTNVQIMFQFNCKQNSPPGPTDKRFSGGEKQDRQSVKTKRQLQQEAENSDLSEMVINQPVNQKTKTYDTIR